MASPRQIAANRRNAKKSTGPRTPEGLAAIRANNLKHGFSAQTLILPGESESDFQDLLDSLEVEHQPVTPDQAALVRRLAMADWRWQRLQHLEAGFLRSKLKDAAPADSIHIRLSRVVSQDMATTNSLANLSRFESRIEGLFHKALRALTTRSAPAKCKSAKSKPIPKSDTHPYRAVP